MTTTVALLRTELTLLLRNSTAWSTAVAIPLLLGGFWALNEPPIGDGLGAVIVLQVVMLLVFTLHTVGTMTLASRREQLVLKRWRSSQASATSVLVGTIGIPAGLVVIQAALLSAITMRLGNQTPASAAMLVLGVIAGVITIAAVTFVVAAFTRSPEHAMITTFPVITLLLGGSGWALTRPFDATDWAVLAIPGGATTQLLRLGWDGPTQPGTDAAAWIGAAGPSLAATVLLTTIAVAAALHYFRWEPRR